MADLRNTVTTIYKAETAQAAQAVRTLRGEEQARARAVLDDLNKHNAGLQGQMAVLGKVTVAFGAVGAAVALGHKAWSAYIEDVRLESAAAGADLAGLQAATHGLVEADNLLAFAGKTMHGVWKLNQEEMEQVLHGAMALRKTMGVELQPTLEALTESITKGNTRALKEFGIEAKDKEGVLRELDGLFQALGGNTALAGDEMAKAGVDMSNAFDDLAGATGKFVNELVPAVKVLADFVGWLAKAGELTDAIAGVDTQGGSAYDQRMRQAGELRGQASYLRQLGFMNPDNAAKADDLERQAAQLEDFAKDQNVRRANRAFADLAKTASVQAAQLERARVAEAVEKANKAFDVLAKEAMAKAGQVRGGGRGGLSGGDYAGKPLDFDLGIYADAASNVGRGLVAGGEKALKSWREGEERYRWDNEQVNELDPAAEARQKQADELKQKGDALASFLGSSPEIDAHAEALAGLSQAYGVLGTAAGDAYEALVTGSGSATEAMKKAIANGLLAMGKDFFVRALGETAMGFAALAIPGLGWNASQHFLAAAAFGSAAVAAGVGAAALGAGRGGGGGSSAASSGGARSGYGSGYPTGGGGGGGGDVNRHVTIILGGDFSDMSQRQRDSAIARAVRRGMSEGQSSTVRMS